LTEAAIPLQARFNLTTGLYIPTEIRSGKSQGVCHQLQGMPGGFSYQGPEPAELANLTNKLRELEIGSIPSDALKNITDMLEKIPISKDESSGWNCQDWTLTAIDALRKAGYIWSGYENDMIKNWLKESNKPS
jgi:hypothetical protein